MDLTSLIIGLVGAITGVISLIWHILNSRSKVLLDRLSFVREKRHDRSEKEVIGVSFNVRNKGDRSTTIEEIWIKIGNRVLTPDLFMPSHVSSNSSERFGFYFNFTPKEFKELLENNKVILGVTIIHTFGILRKNGWTDFSTDYLNL